MEVYPRALLPAGRSGTGLAVLWVVLSAGGAVPSEAQTLLVLNKDDSTLALVDPGTLKVTGTIPTGAIPHEVAASEDGKWAVATNYGAHQDGTTISVIDLTTKKEVHRVDLAGLRGPHGVVFYGGKAWFTVEGSKSIARYDPVANKIDWTHEIGEKRTHMLVLSRDDGTIFTSNVNSNSVTAVVANKDHSSWSNAVIPVGKGPEAIDLSPDESEVWIGNSGDGTVTIVDAASKRVKQTFDVGAKHSNRLKFTPDGKTVLVSDLGSGDLIVVDVPSRKVTKRMNLGKSTEGILIPPGGERAFVAVSGDNKVAVVNLKTLEVEGTFETGKDPDGMAWVR